MTIEITTTKLIRSGPKGVRGWLIVLIVRLWTGTISFLRLGISMGLSKPRKTTFFAVAFHVGLATWAICLGGLAGVSAYLLMRKNAKAPLFAKFFELFHAGFELLEVLTILAVASTAKLGGWPACYKQAGYFFASLAWFAYLKRSRRVANTYNILCKPEKP